MRLPPGNRFFGIYGFLIAGSEVEFLKEILSLLGMSEESSEVKGGLRIWGIDEDVSGDWGGCLRVGELRTMQDLEAELFGCGVPKKGGLDAF